MKNIKSELDDWGRPEYKRSDFGEMVRGKYAAAQIDFAELTALLLTVIGEDDGIEFVQHSIGNSVAGRHSGNWTYEIDNANQITLRYWLNEFRSIEEALSNPTVALTPKERTDLQQALFEGVSNLRARVAGRTER
jgi:hypothetical protein